MIHEILKYAGDTEQQLIIIGSRGLIGIIEMMLGSVSHTRFHSYQVTQSSLCINSFGNCRDDALLY
ncbi:hypothetical protein [Paenibacillus sp. 2RAB27]|uniref:hypothetical protein n=1 Tax=Paenibacillus sp. 2RAB27 TaxID=3232991 RepID=UPI003F972E4A